MVSFGGAACWLYLFPMGLAINSCMPDYTPHYCTYGSRDTKTYAGQPRMRRKLNLVMILMFVIIADIPHCLSTGPRFGKKDHLQLNAFQNSKKCDFEIISLDPREKMAKNGPKNYPNGQNWLKIPLLM